MTAGGSTQAWNLERGDVFTLKPDGKRFQAIQVQHLTVGGEGPNAARPDTVRVAAVLDTGVRSYRDIDAFDRVWIVS